MIPIGTDMYAKFNRIMAASDIKKPILAAYRKDSSLFFMHK
jgi:hypothetical protein